MPTMTPALILVGFFVLALALLPTGIRWIKARAMGGLAASHSEARFISAVAVGPHQRVVTVEVGPQGARTWLTLGVTAQNITCLHSVAVDSPAAATPGRSLQAEPAIGS